MQVSVKTREDRSIERNVENRRKWTNYGEGIPRGMANVLGGEEVVEAESGPRRSRASWD